MAATDDAQTQLARAREMLRASGAPMTAENLNRAMQASYSGAAETPTFDRAMETALNDGRRLTTQGTPRMSPARVEPTRDNPQTGVRLRAGLEEGEEIRNLRDLTMSSNPAAAQATVTDPLGHSDVEANVARDSGGGSDRDAPFNPTGELVVRPVTRGMPDADYNGPRRGTVNAAIPFDPETGVPVGAGLPRQADEAGVNQQDLGGAMLSGMVGGGGGLVARAAARAAGARVSSAGIPMPGPAAQLALPAPAQTPVTQSELVRGLVERLSSTPSGAAQVQQFMRQLSGAPVR